MVSRHATAVPAVYELGYRDLCKVWVAEKLRAVEEGSPIRLERQVHRLCRAVAVLAEVEALKDVERLYQRYAAGRRRRRAQDLVAAIRSSDHGTLFHLVSGKVVGGDQSAALCHIGRNLVRDGALVEVVGICRDRFEGLGQLRLLENVARFVIVPIALEDALGLRELRQVFIAKALGILVTENEPLAREPDGWRHHLLQRELPDTSSRRTPCPPPIPARRWLCSRPGLRRERYCRVHRDTCSRVAFAGAFSR